MTEVIMAADETTWAAYNTWLATRPGVIVVDVATLLGDPTGAGDAGHAIVTSAVIAAIGGCEMSDDEKTRSAFNDWLTSLDAPPLDLPAVAPCDPQYEGNHSHWSEEGFLAAQEALREQHAPRKADGTCPSMGTDA